MLPVLYLAALTVAATMAIALTSRRHWSHAALAAAVGTLAGAVTGAAVGVIIDVATAQGAALQPAGAVGAVLGASGAVVVSRRRRRLTS